MARQLEQLIMNSQPCHSPEWRMAAAQSTSITLSKHAPTQRSCKNRERVEFSGPVASGFRKSRGQGKGFGGGQIRSGLPGRAVAWDWDPIGLKSGTGPWLLGRDREYGAAEPEFDIKIRSTISVPRACLRHSFTKTALPSHNRQRFVQPYIDCLESVDFLDSSLGNLHVEGLDVGPAAQKNRGTP